MVNFAESLGYRLESRDTKSIVIRNLAGEEERFTILENFPFTSERKRMGILLKEDASGILLLLLKGADKEGLRTLVLTQRVVSEEEYAAWKIKFSDASKDLANREAKEEEVICELESRVELLGVTGVEDLLQDDIKTVIENLRAAGIKVWMLTGDKLETAKCIAISTGLKSPNQTFHEIDNPTSIDEFVQKMEQFGANPNQVIIIEGHVLKKVFSKQKARTAFLKHASLAPSVVCCRCAPTQKSEITEAIKNELKKVVCGIGDGGNDVGMIQSANIGIGIEGKEGKQAALAADFSIKQFKTLASLILWTGRLSYVRTSLLANFIIHRGLIISVIQFLFMVIFNFTTIQIYNGYLMLGYATFFTSLPVFSLIYDEDVKWRQVFDYPQLYQLLQVQKQLGPARFLLWIWKSIYQGSTVIILSILLFENTFLEIVTITFTALVLIELLNVVTSINILHRAIVTAVFLSVCLYSVCLVFLQDLFQLTSIDETFFLRVLGITMAAFLPIKLTKWVKSKLYPSLLDKVRRENREQTRRRRGEAEYQSIG